jgi:cytochrome c-type biogenesis protein CcmH/NrfG
MARGATQAQRKRAQPEPKRSKKNAAPTWEEQLFFSRLRRHAKVIYVLLAIVFAAGFVVLGVGSGSTGIGDLLQGKLFGSNGSSISSQIKDKQNQIAAHPNNVSLYLDLSGLYQTDKKESQALSTLQQARKVAPRNVDVLNRIAGIYSARAARAGNNYNSVLNTLVTNDVPNPGLDTSSQLGQALDADPYSQALQGRLQQAYVNVTGAYSKVESVYKQAVDASKGTSNEPSALLQWAGAAQSANDVATAVAAYKKFLKIAPDNPNAATVRQTLAQLEASLPKAQR